MTDVLDDAKTIRKGEEVDVARLEAYLLDGLAGATGPLDVRQFPGGNSNLTYLLRLGDREMVMRRPPFGNQVKSAHDMGREYRVLSKLHRVYRPAPEPYLYCEDESIIGSQFYVMERRHGIVVRETLPPGIAVDETTARTLCESFIDNFADLHNLDYAAAGLSDLGKPEGYAERQVRGWVKRWRNVQTVDTPEIDAVIEWLESRIPTETGAVVVHNDYKYDNMILDPADITRIVAVLDWEMCTLGDPLMDLGATIGYWTEASDPEEFKATRRSPTTIPGSMTRRELVERYGQRTGRDVSNIFYYYAFALFRLAAIVQQIYFRYYKGHTQDERFAVKGEQALRLGRMAARVIETGAW